MPIPKPKNGEDETTKEGKKSKISKSMEGLVRSIEKMVIFTEKEEQREKYIREIPMDLLDDFSRRNQGLFKSIYMQNRIAGREKIKSLNLSLRFMLRNDKENRVVILKSIEKEIKNIWKLGK